jgi:iron(III) transport system substrate-binding protein
MGEDKAFEYLKQMHQNVNAYALGTGPVKAVARGETAVSLSFLHDAVTKKNAGFPVGYNTPCEGQVTRSGRCRSSRRAQLSRRNASMIGR